MSAVTKEILNGGNHTVVVLMPKRVTDIADKLNQLPLAGWCIAYIITPKFNAAKKIDGETYYAHSVSITCPYTKEQAHAFYSRLLDVVNQIKEMTTDRQKVQAIARYICDNVKYENHKYNMFAYSALMDGKAVCAGYARLFRSMCAMCGVKARCVDGMHKGTLHEWNEVFIDNKVYSMDVTFMAKKRVNTLHRV